MNFCRLLSAAGVTVLLAACAGTGLQRNSDLLHTDTSAVASFATQEREVAERYVSVRQPGAELDSLTTWPGPDGQTWLIASAKSAHALMVFDADTGEWLRTVGGPADPGVSFNRPNGVAVHGDRLFVAERDQHRVQVFTLPGFESLGTFGEQQLRSPYGLWLNETAPGELEVYVTDSFMYGKRHEVVPPLDELDQRVRRYRVLWNDEEVLRADYLGSFGDTGEAGALRIVESIAGDPAHARLLIADERFLDRDDRIASTLREYTFDGRFTGHNLPAELFSTEAEGIALWACSHDTGYWIAVDQRATLTGFHLFDRASLLHVGSFRGLATTLSDGIALHAASTRAFPNGALFAAHNDESVSAFDLTDIASTLHLSPECTRQP